MTHGQVMCMQGNNIPVTDLAALQAAQQALNTITGGFGRRRHMLQYNKAQGMTAPALFLMSCYLRVMRITLCSIRSHHCTHAKASCRTCCMPCIQLVLQLIEWPGVACLPVIRPLFSTCFYIQQMEVSIQCSALEGHNSFLRTRVQCGLRQRTSRKVAVRSHLG